MKHLFLVLLCVLGGCSPVLRAQSGSEKFGQRMRVVHRSPRGGYRLCVPVRGQGFCIEGSGRNEGVLLGYAPQGNLQRALSDSLFCAFLQMYDDEAAVQPAFRVLRTDVKPSVAPLLTDSWDQPEPYNICAPMIDGQHCQVGCVALALAQVMHYWRWPARGMGTHTYVDSTGCGQTLTADFSHEYRWDLMRDAYEGAVDSTDASLLETGRLLRDCGIAVDMRYGLHASGARCVRQAIALTSWFGYDKGMQYCFRDFYSRSEWEGMLMRELSAGRPVLFSAQSISLSHALVCDGYDQDGLFHMNFGMGGYTDGYYYLPHLTPQQPEWYDPQSPEAGLNLLQAMTIGVRPADASPVTRHTFGMASIEPIVASASRQGQVSIATSHLSNVGWNETAPGTVCLVLMRDDDVVTTLATYPHAFLLEETTDITYTDTLSFAVDATVCDGLYRVCPAVLESDGTWTLARASTGTPSHVLLRVTQDALTLVSDASAQAHLTIRSCQFPDTVYRGQYPRFSFTLRNDGPAEYCGRLSILLREAGNHSRYHAMQYQGLWLAPGEQVVLNYCRTRVSVSPGDYELCLGYDLNLFTDSLVWLKDEPLCAVHVRPTPPTSVDGVGEACGSVGVRYGLDGVPKPYGWHGVSIEQRHGKYRKIITR